VGRLLSALRAAGDEPVPAPAWRLPAESGQGAKGAPMALRDALAECYDLREPRPTLLPLLLEVR
jgi:hypothetical protein